MTLILSSTVSPLPLPTIECSANSFWKKTRFVSYHLKAISLLASIPFWLCSGFYGSIIRQKTRILYAMNGGEQRIDGHYVVGFDSNNNVICELMGCLWHGCTKCFLPYAMNPVNDNSMEGLRGGPSAK